MVTQAAAGVLQRLSADLKHALTALAGSPPCRDVAFIGNTSGHYGDDLGLMVDFDAFVFTDRLDSALGVPLQELRDSFSARCDAAGVDFELRIVEGAYKPPVTVLPRPFFLAHLGVFTEALYLASPVTKRWAWRKYRCEREPARLARLAPRPPTLAEFVAGPRGLSARREALECGRIEMTEWVLPNLAIRTLVVTAEDPNFIECCFTYAASLARNHARSLRHAEADSLNNAEFFRWYHARVFRSAELGELIALKARCRDVGFDIPVAQARDLAVGYLRALERHLQPAMAAAADA